MSPERRDPHSDGPVELGLVDPTSLEYWQDTHDTLAPLRERWPVVLNHIFVCRVPPRPDHG